MKEPAPSSLCARRWDGSVPSLPGHSSMHDTRHAEKSHFAASLFAGSANISGNTADNGVHSPERGFLKRKKKNPAGGAIEKSITHRQNADTLFSSYTKLGVPQNKANLHAGNYITDLSAPVGTVTSVINSQSIEPRASRVLQSGPQREERKEISNWSFDNFRARLPHGHQ